MNTAFDNDDLSGYIKNLKHRARLFGLARQRQLDQRLHAASRKSARWSLIRDAGIGAVVVATLIVALIRRREGIGPIGPTGVPGPQGPMGVRVENADWADGV